MARVGPNRRVLAALLSTCFGCNAPAEPEPIFESIDGMYVGDFLGFEGAITILVDFNLDLTQSKGDIWGGYTLAGGLSDGHTVIDVEGSGDFSGEVEAGPDPFVSFVLAGGCPGWTASYSGALDSGSGLLSVRGPLDVLDSECGLVLRYDATFLL